MVLFRRPLFFPLVLSLVLLLSGAEAQKPWTEAEQLDFLRRHWSRPIPPQGKPPARFTPVEASLLPESCGTCHPAQLADWKESLHAKSMGPGVKGQLVEMLAGDTESALGCYACHAPLSEQQEKIAGRKGGFLRNPAFDARLQARGLACPACHVRGHQRFGPPKRDGSLASELPRERLPHNSVTRTPAFLRAEFCKDCHQFSPDGFALNGKLLENTYAEWKASPFAQAGVQCQDCHMPDRRHLWRGIHDSEMVRSGVTVGLSTDRERYAVGDTAVATLTVTNSKVGHYFPTYVTPRVVVSGELIDRSGRVVAGSRQEQIIGREVSLDLTRELFDTRLAPGESATFRYRQRLPVAGLTLRVAVTVYPDHFYVGFFEALLAGGAGKGTARVREALRAARSSSFTLYVNEMPLT
ncbi:MAG: multiheme c-type cytochrome [candidate division NC10 bacterium]